MVGLTGTGLVADDLYLLAHHDVSGKPFLQQRALGLGLAGALLAELVLVAALRAGPGGLVAGGGVRVPDQLVAPPYPGVRPEARTSPRPNRLLRPTGSAC